MVEWATLSQQRQQTDSSVAVLALCSPRWHGTHSLGIKPTRRLINVTRGQVRTEKGREKLIQLNRL